MTAAQPRWRAGDANHVELWDAGFGYCEPSPPPGSPAAWLARRLWVAHGTRRGGLILDALSQAPDRRYVEPIQVALWADGRISLAHARASLPRLERAGLVESALVGDGPFRAYRLTEIGRRAQAVRAARGGV